MSCVYLATGALIRSDTDVVRVRGSGVQSVFQIIPKVFTEVESDSELCAAHLSTSTLT